MSVIPTLLLLVYPLVMHFSIHYGRAEIAVYYLATLLLMPLILSLLHRRLPSTWMLGAAFLSLLLAGLGFIKADVMIIIPPVLLFAALFVLFSVSLRAERTPVITRFAEVIRGQDLKPEIRAYTRKATIAWSVFFLIMLFCSLFLGLWAPLEVWSWFSNFLAYVLIGVMFIAEYAVRRYSLPDHVDYSFAQFLHNLRRVDFRHVFK